MARPPQPLSAKDRRFCEHYAASLVAGKAYCEANPDYRGKNADKLAFRMMARPVVREEIRRLIKKTTNRNEINADLVLQELRKIATSDLRVLFDDDGKLKELKDIDDEMGIALSSMEIETHTARDGDESTVQVRTSKVKLWDKMKALEMLGKHLALFAADVDVRSTPEDIRRWREEGRARIAPKKVRKAS